MAQSWGWVKPQWGKACRGTEGSLKIHHQSMFQYQRGRHSDPRQGDSLARCRIPLTGLASPPSLQAHAHTHTRVSPPSLPSPSPPPDTHSGDAPAPPLRHTHLDGGEWRGIGGELDGEEGRRVNLGRVDELQAQQPRESLRKVWWQRGGEAFLAAA